MEKGFFSGFPLSRNDALHPSLSSPRTRGFGEGPGVGLLRLNKLNRSDHLSVRRPQLQGGGVNTGLQAPGFKLQAVETSCLEFVDKGFYILSYEIAEGQRNLAVSREIVGDGRCSAERVRLVCQ